MSRFVLWLFDRLVDLELWSTEKSRAFKLEVERRRLRRKIARDEKLKRKLRALTSQHRIGTSVLRAKPDDVI